jgi:hypothetical protein
VFLRDDDSPVALVPEAKHEYFVVAPILRNGMTVLGDLSKFVTMADQQIESLEEDGRSLRVGVTANAKHNPIISGYSAGRPARVEVDGGQLEPQSSLDRLQAAKSGWFWDYQTRLWHVKVDFAGISNMGTMRFRIYD